MNDTPTTSTIELENNMIYQLRDDVEFKPFVFLFSQHAKEIQALNIAKAPHMGNGIENMTIFAQKCIGRIEDGGEDEMFFVLEGAMDIMTRETTVTAAAGEF